jgi:hypothetical protein
MSLQLAHRPVDDIADAVLSPLGRSSGPRHGAAADGRRAEGFFCVSGEAAETIGIQPRTTVKGSTEFSTWVALAFAAIAVAIAASYSSSLFVWIPAGLIGAFLGLIAERLMRRYVERTLSRKR